MKPPFPASVGLFQCPTIINNVETIACVTLVLERGAEWFAKAVASSPEDATIYLKRAESLIISYQRSHPGKTPLGDQLDPQLASAREAAQRAIELDSELADAHRVIGTTYVYDSGDLVLGIVALEQARRLDPSQPEMGTGAWSGS